MIIQVLSCIKGLNDAMFASFDGFVESLPVEEFVKDAVCDSVHLVPFLFIIFLIIELFETYYSHKIKNVSTYTKKTGPLIGALLAGLPQCGFSVIATPLYINRIITKGTLISIYISTSDEAIPILLSYPNHFKTIFPLLAIKIVLGCISGYAIDALFPQKETVQADSQIETELGEGCCSHHISPKYTGEILVHPIKHTFSIFFMILVISLILNYCFESFGTDLLNNILLTNSILQPVLAGVIGLIPNCAVSVLITMIYINGMLSFPSVISGLSSGAGLGLIVLLKRNRDIKDTLNIIGLLLGISIVAGLLISIFH